MTNCPECGEPLVRGKSRKYHCENERCPVIYVRCPHTPNLTRVVCTSLTKEEIIEEIEKDTAKRRSHVF